MEKLKRMNNKKLKIMLSIIVIILIMVLTCIFIKNNNYSDVILYKGKNYVLLEYKMDIFTYYHNTNYYLEEDIIHPIEHNKWDVVYFNGDLFILENQIEDAKKYYKNDDNYNWYAVIDEEEKYLKKPINITKNELNYLYNMENIKKEESILFNEIQKFADIIKISKDELVYGIISLAQYKNSWYWKTEIMTDNDEEYIIKLPDSLNDKIESERK